VSSVDGSRGLSDVSRRTIHYAHLDLSHQDERGAVARWMRAAYAFKGAAQEISKTLPLAADERVIEDGAIWVRWASVLQRMGAVRLTQSRLVICSHYAFQPDKILEIPAGSLTAVTRGSMGWTRLTFRTADRSSSLDFKPLALFPTFSGSLQTWASSISQQRIEG
jgi:hypothetical protein